MWVRCLGGGRVGLRRSGSRVGEGSRGFCLRSTRMMMTKTTVKRSSKVATVTMAEVVIAVAG